MHLVRITSVLIESMSALEPQTFQYMQFHTARLNISERELEEMRLKLSSHSPMQVLDVDVLLFSLNCPNSYYNISPFLKNIGSS